MSRFDRRLKGSTTGSTSPRPGTATCKIRKKNNTSMLSGFINVVEKNVDNNLENLDTNNSLIQEVSTTSFNKNQNNVVNLLMISCRYG